MATNTSITSVNPLEVKNLDFPQIKESLKNFVQSQTEFKDFNYKGSNISSILDILAYNTYYNLVYLNTMLSEAFIDSATERSSLISSLKPVGFTPKSASCSKILVNITIPVASGDVSTQILVPSFTAFSSSSFTFLNLDSFILKRDGSNFIASSILLHEGVKGTHRFIVDSPSDSFSIPFSRIDTATLRVKVFPNLSSYESRNSLENSLLEYEQASNLYGIDSLSKVYYIQENIDGNYTIYFGDGIFGKSLSKGNVIETTFISSSGSEPNNLSSLSFSKTDLGVSHLSGYTNTSILVEPIVEDLKSFDGSEKQSIESIRKYGSFHFEAQERIITINDYEYYINTYFNNIELLKIWGGEDNDPPRYGSVFCMLKLKGLEKISSYQKELLSKYIKAKSVLGMNFVLVDPNIIFLLPTIQIKIDPRTVKDINLFSEKITSFLSLFITSYSGVTFRPSELIYFLKTQEPLIKSVNISTTLQKNIFAKVNSIETKEISFSSSIIPGSIYSSTNFSLDSSSLYTNEMLLDDSLGSILYSRKNKNSSLVQTLKIGTVDYSLGKLYLNDFLLTAYLDSKDYFSLFALPKDIDLYSSDNSFFSLVLDTIERNIVLDSL